MPRRKPDPKGLSPEVTAMLDGIAVALDRKTGPVPDPTVAEARRLVERIRKRYFAEVDLAEQRAIVQLVGLVQVFKLGMKAPKKRRAAAAEEAPPA